MKIAVTGATGQLGQLVINELAARGIKHHDIIALTRDLGKASEHANAGVTVRQADYTKPATLEAALQGVDKLLLVSSSDFNDRAKQHGNVIAAAKKAGVKLIAYTSILRAPASPLLLAKDHQATEALLASSGVPHVLLRNGWYIENYLMALPAALEHGVVLGASKSGRISAATRADFAAAAAAVLTAKDDQAGKVYELAGDTSFTKAEFAAAIAKISGKPVNYTDMAAKDYAAALVSHGLPEIYGQLLADSDVGISNGVLEDNSKTLSGLIGRGTTSLETLLQAAI